MKVGIEIHQRLATGKLFCRCPSSVGEERGISIYRKQRAVAGELGKVDPAAMQEFMRKRQFAYESVPGCSCLVESDDEPPHSMNREAVAIALEICLLLNAKPVDEIQVMRKTVIDGSNTGGFQRTSVVGLDGELKTDRGNVRIPLICLEEESSGILREEGGNSRFSLDRLGIPLIEVTTDPSIIDGEHAQEVAEKLGMILRATGKVQRGIGTIRQDVNVSTEKGARVEIKGAQELKLIGKMVQTEAYRQEALLQIRAELEKRFKGEPKLEAELVDLTGVFAKTESKLLKKTIENSGKIFGLRMENFKGLIGETVSEGRRFGTELSDYAKANAGVGGIIHSDEDLPKYGINEAEKAKVERSLSIGPKDGYILVADKEEKAKMALEVVRGRALFPGVPEETRRALPEGTSAYMRPLPGSARLYPETDVPPVRIKQDMVEGIKKSLPMMPEQRLKRLESMLKNKELAKKLFNSKEELTFELIVSSEEKMDSAIVAVTLQDTLVNMRRDGVNVDGITVKHLQDMFISCYKGLFVKAAIPEILKYMAQNAGSTCADAVEKLDLKKITGDELKKLVEKESKDFAAIMKKYRIKVDSKEVKELIGG